MTDPVSKPCSICQIEQPMEAFHKDSQKKDGRSSWCIACSQFRTGNPAMTMAEVKAHRRHPQPCEVCEENEAQIAAAVSSAATPPEAQSPPFAPAGRRTAPEAARAPKQRRVLTQAQKDARNKARRDARAAKRTTA